MPASRTRHVILIALGAVAVAAAASGITYAATVTTPQVLHACSNAKGTLRLLQNGHCPAGYSKVGINKQGPRGLPGPGAVRLAVKSASCGVCSQTSGAIAGSGLTVEVLCDPQQDAQVYINVAVAGSAFTVEGDASYSGTGDGNALWLNAAGDGVVTTHLTSTPTVLSTEQVGSEHSVEFTAPGGSLVGDVLVTQANHMFSVEFGEYRDGSNNCWAHALVTPAG